MQQLTFPNLYQLDIIIYAKVQRLAAKVHVLSSSAKPGTHFLENNKITGVFTMFEL